MKEKILLGASDLFISYGFKSVTMDDIAAKLGISKKTIYQYFDNKTKLIEAVSLHLFEFISCGIDSITKKQKNPIEEIYDIKEFVMEHLKDEKSYPQYQLQKYYPKIFSNLKAKQFKIMESCVKDNLTRGIEQGLYRNNFNVEFIFRLYFSASIAIKDQDVFPSKLFPINMIMSMFLEYHLRGICTEKGLKTLKKFITSNQS